MDQNENHSQEFAPEDGGYTQAPESQGAASGQYDGQQSGGYQTSGQFGGQQNGGYQASGQFGGQQSGGYQNPGQFGGQMNGQPYMGQGYMPQQKDPMGYAIAGMVLGIVSIVCCCSPFVGGVTGVLGLIFSIMVLVQKRPGKGMAIAGVICAAIGLILMVSMLVANNSMMDYINSQGGMENIFRNLDSNGDFY
ncbi:MAG: DUF4190 domain-containing protein [Lachnospiraceae bacterium]|nr:DUF4190 domain-containing protein [Lachnospiraceae bacterium]